MAVLPLSHSETKSEQQNQSPTHISKTLRLSGVREKGSASEMTGRMLGAEAATGARMNKAKIVKVAVVSVLAMLLLTAAALSLACYDGAELRAFFGSDTFLMFCVVTHLTTICLLARSAATAPTPAARRYYADSTVASSMHLAFNLYFVLLGCPKKVQDAAA